jgi:hypothetical protein
VVVQAYIFFQTSLFVNLLLRIETLIGFLCVVLITRIDIVEVPEVKTTRQTHAYQTMKSLYPMQTRYIRQAY